MHLRRRTRLLLCVKRRCILRRPFARRFMARQCTSDMATGITRIMVIGVITVAGAIMEDMLMAVDTEITGTEVITAGIGN